MGYPTKVQLIRRKASEQWYVNFPAAIARAMEFERGETVEWIIDDKANLRMHRPSMPPSTLKKKRQSPSAGDSTNSGKNAGRPANKKGS